MRNKRKNFRIKLVNPLCASMTIVMVNENLVECGISKICIQDIGPGGLKFTTNLKLPISRQILLSFKFMIFDKEMEFLGWIVRSGSIDKKTFEYGVQFMTIERKNTEYVYQLNKLALFLKKVDRLGSCSFCFRERFQDCIFTNQNQIG